LGRKRETSRTSKRNSPYCLMVSSSHRLIIHPTFFVGIFTGRDTRTVSPWNLILSPPFILSRTRRTRRILKRQTLGKLCPTHRSKLSPPICTHYLFFPAKYLQGLELHEVIASFAVDYEVANPPSTNTECLEVGAILSLRHQDKYITYV
jgi:hypothetical protein